MKILIYGMGAIGTVYANLLARAGHQVWGWDVPQVVEAIPGQQVKITGLWGDHSTKIKQLVSAAPQLEETNFDFIVITVKAYDTSQAAQNIQPFVSPHTYVFLGQNGYGNYEAACRWLPEQNIVVGRIIFGAETMAAGFSKVSVIADDVLLGTPRNLIPPDQLRDLAEMFTAAGLPTRVEPEIMKYVWGKIIYNSALNPLGAVLEVNYGCLADNPHTKELMDGIIEEIFAVLHALGQDMPWPDAESYRQDFYQRLIPPTREHISSMLQDIRRGRKTEINAMNGAVWRLGQKHQIVTPVNQVLTKLVQAKEQMAAVGKVEPIQVNGI